MAHELKSYVDCYHRTENLSYWRSTSKMEVDFILYDEIAIEVKATQKVVPSDLKGLKALKEEKQMKAYVLVSLDPTPRNEDGILILPILEFLEHLWEHDQFRRL